MIILVSSKISQIDIHDSLGKPEYSYFFLMKEYIPALERVGKVIIVDDLVQVDDLYSQHLALGEQVVFLSFSPPHQTPIGLRCPTYCVFAWEFDCIPEEALGGDPRHDWRYVFSRIAGAIALSQEAATAVVRAMGETYPVIALPAPLWDRYSDFGKAAPAGPLPVLDMRQLTFVGHAIDSPLLGLSADGLAQQPVPVLQEQVVQALTGWPLRFATTRALAAGWWREAVEPFLSGAQVDCVDSKMPAPAPSVLQLETIEQPIEVKSSLPSQLVKLSGVVYTSVLNPEDGRKNWIDLISAFCWAFKDEGDATLIVKMVHSDPESYRIKVMTHLSRLSPFKCRVLVVHGYLETEEYRRLIEVSTFYVNSSACEGLCLPLVEYLCSGKPAISPLHTAMLDYVNADMAVLVKSSTEPASFLHDPANRLRTRRYRQSWDSLVQAYQTSYQIATCEPERYRQMSLAARSGLRDFCSVERVSRTLTVFLASRVAETGSIENREFQA